MKTLLVILLLLYVVALHTSMAGMEIVSSLIIAAALFGLARERRFALFSQNRPVNYAMLAMTLAVLASLVFNPPLKPFLIQFGCMRWILWLWGLAWALDQVWSPAFERKLIPLWITLVVVTGAYATLQNVSGIDFLRNDALETPGGGVWRAVGWFSESLNFAYSFGVSIFALSRPAFARNKTWAWIAVIAGGLGIIATISRGAWLAAILCVLFYLAFERRLWVLPAAAFFYGVSKVLIWFSPGFGGKIKDMEKLTLDVSSAMRVDLWRAYWQMFLDHPWFGIGWLQGDKLLPEYYAKLGIVQPFVSHAHNNFLQFLGGTGIFGFLSYCAVSLLFAYKAWRLRKVTPWGWSLFLAQMFLQAGGMTQCNFIAAGNLHMLVFCWAILLVVEARHVSISKMAQQNITI